MEIFYTDCCDPKRKVPHNSNNLFASLMMALSRTNVDVMGDDDVVDVILSVVLG